MSANPRVVYDEWEVYTANFEDGPMFISFDVAAAREDLSKALPHCARVIIPIHAPNQNGGPTEPESTKLYDMEDEVCGMLSEHGTKCRLVGRLTHRGTRELVFQLADWDSFRPPVGYWITQYEDYEIDVAEH